MLPVVAIVFLAACTGGGVATPTSDVDPEVAVTSATGSTTPDEADDPSPEVTADQTPPETEAPPAAASFREGADGLTCWTAVPAAGSDPADGISFADITAASNLVEPLTGMFGHAAAWGDIDGDLAPDLVVGTFADRQQERYRERGATEAAPDRVLLQRTTSFLVDDRFPEEYGRTSGAVLVDLDADADLDLVLSRNVKEKQQGMAATAVYENTDGALSAIDSGIDGDLGGRSIGVLDYDGDGLLDLFIVEDKYRGGSSRLYRNRGELRFEDTTAEAGLPADLQGLGVATSDVDADGDVDLFVAGDNILFLDQGETFVASPSAVFAWPPVGTEDDPAGAAFGDVDRDGRPDLVVGQHFNSTVDFGTPAPVRLFLNRTEGETVEFEEVTEAAGLVPLPTKAPHVEIVDFDNDGWPDVLTTASADGGTRPAIFRGLGLEDGIPRFAAPDELGDPQYWVTGPVSDVDRDGRLDVFLLEFEPSLASHLLANETRSGNWLSVSVDPGLGAGIGARVVVSDDGARSDPSQILGSADITASRGYTAGIEAIAHFGLGGTERVDVEVLLSDGSTLRAEGVAANRHIRLPDGCTAG